MNSTKTDNQAKNIREQLLETIEHLEHILPGQAPIRDFVHHNTLHGLQHLDFTDAIAESHRITGADGFLPHEKFREYFQQGRIDESDISSVLDEDESLSSQETIADIDARKLSKKEIYRAALLFDFEPITRSHLHWLIEEQHVLSHFQQDINKPQREQLLKAAGAYDQIHGQTRDLNTD